MTLLSLADRLHMSIAEAEQTPVTHLNEWVAYHNIVGEANDKTNSNNTERIR
jgi:hypothetical protein